MLQLQVQEGKMEGAVYNGQSAVDQEGAGSDCLREQRLCPSTYSNHPDPLPPGQGKIKAAQNACSDPAMPHSHPKEVSAENRLHVPGPGETGTQHRRRFGTRGRLLGTNSLLASQTGPPSKPA